MPRKYARKPNDGLLSRNLSVPMTASDLEALQDIAAAAGTSTAEYVRRMISARITAGQKIHESDAKLADQVQAHKGAA